MESLGLSPYLSSGPHNYVSFFSPKANYQLPPEEQVMEDFWINYCRLRIEADRKLSIGERASQYMPVIIRGELHFGGSEGSFEFDDSFINNLVYCFQRAVSDNIVANTTGAVAPHELLVCAFLQTESYLRIEGKLSFPFILHFPYCKVESTFQRDVIIPDGLEYMRKCNLLGKLASQPINIDSIINPNSAMEPNTLLGSQTQENGLPFYVSRYLPRIENPEVDFEDYELAEIFDLRKHELTLGDVPILNARLDVENGRDHYFWEPLFLSINYLAKVVQKPLRKVTAKQVVSGRSGTEKEQLSHFLGMISPSRYENRGYWLDLGRVIYNIYEGSDEGLSLWRERCHNRSSSGEEMETLYSSFAVDNHLTVKTAAYYSRLDNPELYNKWQLEWMKANYDKSTSMTHTDVAELFYKQYWLNYVCSDAKKGIWYSYVGHRWKLMDGDVYISRKISSEFKDSIEKYRWSLNGEQVNASNEDEKKLIEAKINALSSLIGKLKSVPYKNSLKKELIEFFFNEKFDSLLDENWNITGFPSSVLEVIESPTGRSVVVRDGKPEDFISRATRAPYRKDYSWEHKDVKMAMYFFEQFQTNKDTRHNFLKLLGSLLLGGNPDKSFFILTGKKHNAKSQMKKLLECVLGPNYQCTTPVEVFTRKKTSSSGPNPEVAQTKSTRALFVQEPDNDSSFVESFLKIITGGDTFFARAMKKNGGAIRSSFKTFLFCNGVPAFPYADPAVKDRFCIFPCASTWVRNAPDTEKEQFEKRLFPMDPYFEHRLPSYAPPALWIMVEYLKIYLQEGLQKTEEMNEAIAEYWRDNDPYFMFISEKLEQVFTDKEKTNRDLTLALSVNDGVREFKFWFKETFESKAPKPADVKKQLIEKLGTPTADGWRGWGLKQPDFGF